MTSRIITKFGIFFLNVLSRFPFWLIYLISDVLYFIIYFVIRYRKKVIINNLKNAFPDKTDTDRHKIMKLFYRHFCDLMLESVVVSGMKEKDFDERLDIQNVDIVDNYFNQGKSLVALTMHYNNWEWGTRLSKFVQHKILAVYKPLHNAEFDKYMNDTRTVQGTEMIKNNQILRRIIKAEKKKEPVIVWLAGDQTPPVFHSSWYLFLNQEAMFYPGSATLSKQFNLPIVFQWVEKTARGKYKSKVELLIDNPSEMSETDIIKTYIRKMEEVIREKPEFYLWSHKRWKHKRPSDVPLQ